MGLITLAKGLTTQNLPGKMLGYMYHAKPILASVNPGNDLKTVLEEAGAGLVCLNGDDEAFAGNARRLFNDKELRVRMGRSGRALLEKTFSVNNAAFHILSHFRK